ncbi:MAG TPA: DUF3667 domain-containing protein, partial [Povalibacter sp.]|nr:DUF3667 domain-containing protein [Povalibacter sp.]
MNALSHCRNCAEPLTARYCAGCGQDSHAKARSFAHVLSELTESFLHLDSAIWRTLLGLIVAPGRVTAEYLQGKRVKYTPPFRLYIVISLLFFAVAATNSHFRLVTVGNDVSGVVVYSPTVDCERVRAKSPGPPWIGEGLARGCRQSLVDGGRALDHVIWTSVPKAFLVLVPVFALLTYLLYWRARLFYVEHLIFITYLHSAFFLGAGVL